ncbi:MAG TPA: hypothetical protein VHF26_21910 [Trebonia sp.]|jgi:hypothetical protein|nr:hypothetical protein [Trebonia sp.]
MSYTPKHAKPVPGKEDKDGAHRTFGLVEASAGRHAAPAGRPQPTRRGQATQGKIAA